MNKTIIKNLTAAQALISDKINWTKGELARDAHSHRVSPTSARACKFCTVGSVIAITNEDIHASPMLDYLEDFMGYDLPNANDNSTHLQVMMAFDFAILAAKDGMKANK